MWGCGLGGMEAGGGPVDLCNKDGSVSNSHVSIWRLKIAKELHLRLACHAVVIESRAGMGCLFVRPQVQGVVRPPGPIEMT